MPNESKAATKIAKIKPPITGAGIQIRFKKLTWLTIALDSFGMVKIKLDASFIQDFFMLAFFTTIGLGASLKLFKLGGKVSTKHKV
jgi:sodium--glutamate symport carrier gltS